MSAGPTCCDSSSELTQLWPQMGAEGADGQQASLLHPAKLGKSCRAVAAGAPRYRIALGQKQWQASDPGGEVAGNPF